jgi:hypothetical protein
MKRSDKESDSACPTLFLESVDWMDVTEQVICHYVCVYVVLKVLIASGGCDVGWKNKVSEM